MAVTATNLLSVPLARLRTLLASLSATQSWMGAANTAAALLQIHLNQFDEPAGEAGTPAWKAAAEALRPLIVLGTDTMSSNEEDTGPYGPKTGVIWVDFEEIAQNENGVASDSNAVSTSDAILSLMNDVGAIMEEAEEAVSTTAATAAVSGAVFDMVGWDVVKQASRTMIEHRNDANGLDLCGMGINIRRRDM